MSSIAKRPDGRWRARYRDADDREHSKHFSRRVDAQRWLDEVTAAVVTGQYVDPNAGRITFRTYAEQWRLAQVNRPSSAAHVKTMLRRHAYPAFGNKARSTIKPSEMQAWVKKLGDGAGTQKALQPATVHVAHGIVAAIFKAAARDRKVASSPCEGVKLPKVEPGRSCPCPQRLSWLWPRPCHPVTRPWCSSPPGRGCDKGRRSGSPSIVWTSCCGA